MMARNQIIGLTPDVRGVGGMVSFRHKFTAGLEARGIRVTSDLQDPDLDALLVIGGTRNLAGLQRVKQRGVRIVQRLDGMNWLHKRLIIGLRHTLRAEIANLLMQTIRRRYADGIVYQSAFSKSWWESVYGEVSASTRVAYNAVDLDAYNPDGPHDRPNDHYRILIVEGSLQGGYETGLETAVQLVAALREHHGLDTRLAVAGKVSQEVMGRYNPADQPVEWLGLVPRGEIPRIDRSAHLLFSADINAACPNSVIEALACGLPVAAFDTGALPELVPPEAGAVTPYGGDPWKLDSPDISGLASAAASVLQAGDTPRAAARKHAEAHFSLDDMVNRYLDALLDPAA